MKELLTGGQRTPALGASHAENAAVGGGAMYLRGLAEGEHGTSQLGVPPQVEHAGGQAEMGGGEPVDPVNDWIAQKGGYEKLLQLIQQNQWGDGLVWKLDDGTKLSVAEVKRRAAAAATSPLPESQPAPRSADWRDQLPLDQRQRLGEKEKRWSQLQPAQLVAMQEKIATALSNWGLGIEWPDEFKKVGLLVEDGEVLLKALVEAAEDRKEEILKRRIDETLALVPEASAHIQRLQTELGLSSKEAVVAKLIAELQTAISIGKNTDVNLFPPRIKHILIQFIKSGNGKVN